MMRRQTLVQKLARTRLTCPAAAAGASALNLSSVLQLADVRLVRHRSHTAAGHVHGAAERREVDDAAALGAADGRLLGRAREAVWVRRPAQQC